MAWVDLNTLHDPASGTRPPATWGDAVRDDLQFLYSGALGSEAAWSTYTPALTGSGGNPNLGSTGTAVGRYRKAGRLVVCHVQFNFAGSGISAGTGTYIVSLPANAGTTMANRRVGQWTGFDASASGMAMGMAYIASATTLQMLYPATWPNGTQTFLAATAPWTWATGDEIHLLFIYESAA